MKIPRFKGSAKQWGLEFKMLGIVFDPCMIHNRISSHRSINPILPMCLTNHQSKYIGKISSIMSELERDFAYNAMTGRYT